MINEVWRDVPGYDGVYKVSNYGRVITTGHPRGKTERKNKFLKQVSNSNGYLRVNLRTLNGELKRPFVHRLVAEAFVNKPEGCDVVNHLDFDPKNNSASNLEWTTQPENFEYSFRRGRFKRTAEWRRNLKKGLDEKMGKPVVGENLETGEKIYFKALNDVRGAGFQPSCVCNCCKGIRATHGGYKWRYNSRRSENESA